MAASVKRTASVPEVFHHLDGVDYVALGLRHLLPVRIPYQSVDVHLAKRHRVLQRALAAVGHRLFQHEVAAQHNHARHPEEKDVETGDQQLGGIKSIEIRVCSGHPSDEQGNRPEENQVSRTSFSCSMRSLLQ